MHFLTLTTFSHRWRLYLFPAPSPSCCGDRARTPHRQLRPLQVRVLESVAFRTEAPVTHSLLRAAGLWHPGCPRTIHQVVVNWPVFLALTRHLPRCPPSHRWQRRFKPEGHVGRLALTAGASLGRARERSGMISAPEEGRWLALYRWGKGRGPCLCLPQAWVLPRQWSLSPDFSSR